MGAAIGLTILALWLLGLAFDGAKVAWFTLVLGVMAWGVIDALV